MPDGPIVFLILLVVGGVLVGGYFYLEHRRHAREAPRGREPERLPLFGTELLATRGEDGTVHAAAEQDPAAPRPVRRTPAVPRPTLDRNETPPSFVPPMAAPPNGAGAPPGARPAANGYGYGAVGGVGSGAPGTPPYAAPYPTAPGNGARPGGAFAPVGAAAVAGDLSHASLVNGETLRFAVADEGTLRFLPGRLEVSAGPDAGREVRFVAPPGGKGDGPIEITFGRTEGPAYRHIQLLARTVSRRHARMLLTDDHWSLQNLSATNPVLLNGRPLAADEVAPLLVDGDRIEMGEVVFTFHSR